MRPLCVFFKQYFFEFAFDEIKARPRHVLPYAVVSFKYKGKEAAATPMTSHRYRLTSRGRDLQRVVMTCVFKPALSLSLYHYLALSLSLSLCHSLSLSLSLSLTLPPSLSPPPPPSLSHRFNTISSEGSRGEDKVY